MLFFVDVIELASFAVLGLIALVWWLAASVRSLWRRFTRTR